LHPALISPISVTKIKLSGNCRQNGKNGKRSSAIASKLHISISNERQLAEKLLPMVAKKSAPNWKVKKKGRDPHGKNCKFSIPQMEHKRKPLKCRLQ